MPRELQDCIAKAMKFNPIYQSDLASELRQGIEVVDRIRYDKGELKYIKLAFQAILSHEVACQAKLVAEGVMDGDKEALEAEGEKLVAEIKKNSPAFTPQELEEIKRAEQVMQQQEAIKMLMQSQAEQGKEGDADSKIDDEQMKQLMQSLMGGGAMEEDASATKDNNTQVDTNNLGSDQAERLHNSQEEDSHTKHPKPSKELGQTR